MTRAHFDAQTGPKGALLVGGPDQVFAKWGALGEGLLGIPQCAGVKVGLDVVVARFPVGVGATRIFLGLQPVQFLDGRDRPLHPGRRYRVLTTQGGEK